MVTQTITLSMIPGGVTPRIYASQNDHGLRVFVFNLVDENGGYAIPSGTTALLNVLKPDRTVVSETCTWSGSTVTADCTEQMTAVAGNVHCEVRLVAANGDAVGSANFILGVESNPLASGVVSESDFDSISDMVDRAVAAASIPPTYVTDWLEDNITQETGYVIDQSLTIENAAADAKAAGDLIRAAFVVGEASGSIASFADGADGVPVKDLVVNITPKQAGTGDPSPTNVRAISGWTGANVTRTGNNILDQSWAFGNIDNTGADSGTSKNYIRSESYVRVQPSTTYNAIYQGTEGTLQIYGVFYDNEMNAVQRSAIKAFSSVTTSATFTVTTPNTAAWLRVFFYKTPVYTSASGELLCLSIDALDEYEPYNGNTYTVSFGSAGTVYGGTLDVTSGMLTVTWVSANLGNVTSWNYYTGGTHPVFRTTWFANRRIGANSDGVYGLCSCYKFAGNGTLSNLTSSMPDLSFGYQSTASWINFRDDRFIDVDSFGASLNGQYICYELAEPISYQLTPTEVKSLLGNNNIWSDTGSVASCEYRADTKLYLEKLTNPDDDMVANANITSGSYFMTGNTLYKATANIANGATIIPGTNCTRKSLAEALNEINA